MAEGWRCTRCDNIFSSLEDYQNHTCRISTYGGSGDLRKAKQETEEGTTGGGHPKN